MEISEKVKRIAEHYGYDAQSRQCIEEMAELTQAINKMWRSSLKMGELDLEDVVFLDKIETGLVQFSECTEYKNIVEEMADVQIMLWQMIILLGADIAPIIEKKLDRQMERIEKNGNT